MGQENKKGVEGVRAAILSALKNIPETGGPKGLEPTRYGDWDVNGRCTDF